MKISVLSPWKYFGSLVGVHIVNWNQSIGLYIKTDEIDGLKNTATLKKTFCRKFEVGKFFCDVSSDV